MDSFVRKHKMRHGLGLCHWAVLVGQFISWSLVAHSHQIGTPGTDLQSWQTDQISRAYSTVWHGRVTDVGGRRCIQGRALLFDVHDAFAYDIDEDVNLIIDVATVGPVPPNIVLFYEKNGEGPIMRELDLAGESIDGFVSTTIRLERARFANDGTADTDFSLVSLSGSDVSIAAIQIIRSHTTPISKLYGKLVLTVTDDKGAEAPALVGLYDERNRLPLPSAQAVQIRLGFDFKRIVSRQSFGGIGLHGASLHWPAENQSAFYVNGHYEAEVPVGRYELVVSKGPEYRIFQKTIEVNLSGIAVEARLPRWDNLGAQGWFSGDDHIHYTREDEHDDQTLLLLCKAEGLNVANILQMGNVANTHFRPYSWKVVADESDPTYVIVPGQEDPRTGYRGHAIGLYLREAVRESENYLLYDLVFRRIRAQGGMTGYAHVGWPNPTILAGRRGLALDVPKGLVDFVEVLQGGTANLQTWFNFLNLGFKLTPSAGTDFPAVDQRPGAVRNYVKINGEFSVAAWFEAFKAGRTFVTNGPVLEFSINEEGMGSELMLDPGSRLKVKARARLNPDLDKLDCLELVEQGQVVRRIESRGDAQMLSLECEIEARRGTWFVVQARGKRGGHGPTTFAVTAPIYVHVGGKGFWLKEAVPGIVETLKQDLDLLSLYQPSNDEAHETLELFERVWQAQQIPLQERANDARAFYDDLVLKSSRPD